MKQALFLITLLATAAGASARVVSPLNDWPASSAPVSPSLTAVAAAAAMIVMMLAYARRHRVRVIRVRRRWPSVP